MKECGNLMSEFILDVGKKSGLSPKIFAFNDCTEMRKQKRSDTEES